MSADASKDRTIAEKSGRNRENSVLSHMRDGPAHNGRELGQSLALGVAPY